MASSGEKSLAVGHISGFQIDPKENTDDWKEKLRSAFISAFSGNPQENIQVYTEVGYYYMCCAPSSLYKYYSDRQEKLETVKEFHCMYLAYIIVRLKCG